MLLVMTLRSFFHPRSVAVIGASRTPGHVGYVILENFTKSGFKGKIYGVNPHADEILGVRCVASVLDITEAVELAVVAVPAEMVIPVVRECGKKGVKHIILVTA